MDVKTADNPKSIRIEQIFLERCRFEHRADYLAVDASTKPDGGKLDLRIALSSNGANPSSIALRIGAVLGPEAGSVYSFDVMMCALLQLDAPMNPEVAEAVTQSAATIALPFLREAIAGLTGRGRFGPIWIQPVNVRTLIMRAKQSGGDATRVLYSAEAPPRGHVAEHPTVPPLASADAEQQPGAERKRPSRSRRGRS